MPKLDIAIPAYNAHDTLKGVVESIQAQQLPDGWSVSIYIADDCSGIPLAPLISAIAPSATVLRHAENRGRSSACNSAAWAGDGEIVTVLDADCSFASSDSLARALAHVKRGADVVLGSVEAAGQGFWPRYARLVARNRVSRARAEGAWHMTTANFTVRREVLARSGGFNEAYRHYGFEDRDLLLRLMRDGARMVIADDVVVHHREPASVKEVCGKLQCSGRHSARIFATNFPEMYRQSRYARLDLTANPKVAAAALPVLAQLAPVSSAVADRLIRAPLPFAVKAMALQAASALSYLRGSCEAAVGNPHQ